VVRRLRQHVNPLALQHVSVRAEAVALPSDLPIEVELGCADARFLFERAAAESHVRLVGVEIRKDLVERVNRRAAADQLGDRLIAIHANISTDLERLFRPRSVRRFHLNFPDPWFKRRHQKRRVLTPEVAAVLRSQLEAGGEVFFQSDVFELALDAMAAIEETELFRNLHGPWSFAGRNPFGARSKREARVEELGKRVWRLLYGVRTSSL
jgi:tRNA (guanine-N7-)-methyltransferase